MLKNRVIKRLSGFLALIMILSSVFTIGMPMMVVAEEETFVETFDGLEYSGSSYISGSFIGEYGIEWNYEGARGDLDEYEIDGKGMMFRRSGANSKVYATIEGGIGDFSVDLKKAFTTNTKREVELLINGESRGRFELDLSNDGVQRFQVDNINLEGEFTLEIRHVSGGSTNAQITVDNITWTSYSGGTVEPIPLESIEIEGENEISVGSITRLDVIYTPANTTQKGVTWSSSDETIAIVDENGVVTGIAEGVITIEANSVYDESINAIHEMTVKPLVIQTIAEARELNIGDSATVQGIVTFIDSNDNYFIQDETAAIDIYKYGEDLGLEIGDEVVVTGKIDEYGGLLEIIPQGEGDISVVSKNNELPEPELVTFGDIKTGNYECERVKVEQVYIREINYDFNTTIEDLSGDTLIIFKMPELEDIEEGDLVDIVGFGSIHKGTYQLRVYSADDITKTELGPDTKAPVIEHEPITEANINLDLEIKAKVTDDRTIEEVILFYKTKEEIEYKEKEMFLIDEEYATVILKSELDMAGLEYYIWATDGTNETRLPEDENNPYFVEIVDEDITPPRIFNIEPKEDAILDETVTKPTIRAEYEDPSGIDTNSIQMFIDGIDVTENTTITEENITYTPEEDLKLGNHTVMVRVKDNKGNEVSKTWTFTIGELEYGFRFGQLHSHTNVSDGTGTPDDAYSWARDKGKADFFAVTDHSNWFDNELDNENITDTSQSTSSDWKLLNQKADEYNEDGEYVALAGYEMTWSGSTGGWGHINTFNTPWFVSRNNRDMDLPAYYEKIGEWPESINQLNHPGKTFGDFADFGFYSEETDNVVQLIEVGNGEGPIRGSGYFPSYEYYTRALDKGWHLAPSNNQDNHKGNWITSNEARTVILSEELTRDSIYDGIRDMRVYATENKNLEIMYKINGQVMGSKLRSPDKLNVSININEPDVDDLDQKITRVELISNGGVVAASQNFDNYDIDWNFQLDPMYDYYYVRVAQANGDISVTSPIWVGEVLPVGLSGLDVSSDYFELGDTIELIATVYNNGNSIISNAKVEFYVDSISSENKIGEDIVENIGQGSTAKASARWTPEEAREYNLYAVATIAGVEKTFTVSKRVEAVSKGSAVKVMVDYAHSNHYVSGDYAGMIESLKEMLKVKKMIMVENYQTITDEVLEDIDILIITSPQPKDKGEVNRSKLSHKEIEAVVKFTNGGGSLILTSRANYGDGTGEYQNSIQGNKVLNAIGSNIIFNSDQVVDYENNGGQQYRLYFENYVSEKYNLTLGLGEGDEYSFYSGCSVILKDGGNEENVDFLVKGHSTTKNENAGKTPTGYIEIEQGKVHVLAAEILPSGGKIIASGSTFFSDFEMSGDNRYSNIEITSNILDWLKPERQVEVKTIKEVRDGMPENFGQEFAIEGRVTAMSEAYAKEKNIPNAFFEVIYIQDETGGITIFGVSQTKLSLGTKVRIIGTAGQYEGDYQLQINNEVEDLVVLDEQIKEVEPKLLSTADSMKKENEGWLVKVQGIVTRIDIEDNSLYVKDDSGKEARVYVNGYIGGNPDYRYGLGRWDPKIKVGDVVSVIGLVSTDPVGPRLRVRNTSEIIRISDEYPIVIRGVEKTEVGDKFGVKVDVENIADDNINGVIIIKPIDDKDRSYKVIYKDVKLSLGLNTVEFILDTADYINGIKNIKVYIWDSLENMKPLADI